MLGGWCEGGGGLYSNIRYRARDEQMLSRTDAFTNRCCPGHLVAQRKTHIINHPPRCHAISKTSTLRVEAKAPPSACSSARPTDENPPSVSLSKAERLIVGSGWVGVSLAHILRNLGVHLRGQATGREEGVSKDEHQGRFQDSELRTLATTCSNDSFESAPFAHCPYPSSAQCREQCGSWGCKGRSPVHSRAFVWEPWRGSRGYF